MSTAWAHLLVLAGKKKSGSTTGMGFRRNKYKFDILKCGKQKMYVFVYMEMCKQIYNKVDIR